ncbi:hypothetical protein B0H14DRAFT_3145720 [Mycena olivaceomarginata]|nr:hypothetical protein B0H14DRAFT_3145720 [Mycena olivaceomarginata]
MTRSSRTHRLRRGTVVYAAGFVATVDQMESMARNVCDAEFLKRHGDDCVYALKWHVSRYEYEILDNDRPGTYFFAVHFFPWRGADLKKALPCQMSRGTSGTKLSADMRPPRAMKSARCPTLQMAERISFWKDASKTSSPLMTSGTSWSLLRERVP